MAKHQNIQITHIKLENRNIVNTKKIYRCKCLKLWGWGMEDSLSNIQKIKTIMEILKYYLPLKTILLYYNKSTQ